MKINPPKVCKCCGKSYKAVPKKHHKDINEMYWWDCECGTSMTHIPDVEKTKKLLRGSK